MHHRRQIILKVNNSTAIAADVCFIKCKIFEGEDCKITRHWFDEKYEKSLRSVLREAVGLYRAVREQPAQLETMLDAGQASIALSGELKVAYVFKRTSAPPQLVLEARSESPSQDQDCGGQFRSLHIDDVTLAVSVALIGGQDEGAGLSSLTCPIGASAQPTVSSYFKAASTGTRKEKM